MQTRLLVPVPANKKAWVGVGSVASMGVALSGGGEAAWLGCSERGRSRAAKAVDAVGVRRYRDTCTE